MERIKELDILGWGLILFSAGFILLVIFFDSLSIHLMLSASYSSKSEFGPAGEEIVQGFSLIIAALLIVMGIFMLYLSTHYNPDAFPYLLGGITTWFIIDNLSSYFYGYEYNVLLNILIFLVMLFLLLRVNKKYPRTS